MTWLILGLVVSLLVNSLLVWYCFKILGKLLYTSDNLGDLYIIFHEFERFISSLYEMEMFYGEPIIEELIGRTKMVQQELNKFEEIYSLTTDVELIKEEIADARNAADQEAP
jgi:hypothetical protein